MAVYTDVTAEDLSAHLARYDIGELLSFKGIAEGVENSNFLLHTTGGTFILTLYEKRVDPADLPFFIGLMEHLAARGLTCPQPVRMRSGETLGELAGRPAAIVTFLEGMWIRRPQVHHCAAVGRALAQLHIAGQGFEITRVNALSVPGWRPLAERAARAPTRSRPALPPPSPPNSPIARRTGRRACRPASSMPISSTTTSSSCTTSSPG